MSTEIERKFLVTGDHWREAVIRSEWRRQGYIARTPLSCVRVRSSPTEGAITIKSARCGIVRDEFEYRIPLAEAEHMLARLCVTPIIEKERHWVKHGGMIWEVDVFAGQAHGLVLAEIELRRTDQPFVLPGWVGAEVTHDLRYRSQGVAHGLWREATAPGGGRLARRPRRPRRQGPIPSPQSHP